MGCFSASPKRSVPEVLPGLTAVLMMCVSSRQPLQGRKALPRGEGTSVDMDGLSGDVPGTRGSEEVGGLDDVVDRAGPFVVRLLHQCTVAFVAQPAGSAKDGSLGRIGFE
jgi:hypothetical protein